MIYGYCRVSSKGQVDNNSLEQQQQEILSRYENAKIYTEQFTGKTSQRPVFQEVLNQIKEGDTLVCTKLDRFCRSTKDGLATIEQLKDKKINIHILNMGLIEANNPMGDLIVTCLLAFSQFERSMILERTSTGKAIAKQDPNFKEGRPAKDQELLEKAYEMKLNGAGLEEIQQVTGVSKSTLYRYIKTLDK